jgi:hypothetical protein
VLSGTILNAGNFVRAENDEEALYESVKGLSSSVAVSLLELLQQASHPVQRL